jgi:hypothetical protein
MIVALDEAFCACLKSNKDVFATVANSAAEYLMTARPASSWTTLHALQLLFGLSVDGESRKDVWREWN